MPSFDPLRPYDELTLLSQREIAELFGTSVPNVNIHVRNIVKDGELTEDAVITKSLMTAADGKRYRTQTYRLEMILAIGYRVRSPRGTQFRQWAPPPTSANTWSRASSWTTSA